MNEITQGTEIAAPIAHFTNTRVNFLRGKHDLTRKQIAEICGCSKSWVDSWFADPGTRYYRECPENMARLLEFELGLRYCEHSDEKRELKKLRAKVS